MDSAPASIHTFRHPAMATEFEVRIAGGEPDYAAQAAQAAFAMADRLETLLSRFTEQSEISAIAALQPGEQLRLSEPVFTCLETAVALERFTRGAFALTATAVRAPGEPPPDWSLNRDALTIACRRGRLAFDLGAIGKGFALDRMAEELAEWECPPWLLIAGGSSVLAGAPPPGTPGWEARLEEGGSVRRCWLAQGALGGSGVGMQGLHILDPRTGASAPRRARAWARAHSAAEADALSTAAMVLGEDELAEIMAARADAQVILCDAGRWRAYGQPPARVAEDEI